MKNKECGEQKPLLSIVIPFLGESMPSRLMEWLNDFDFPVYAVLFAENTVVLPENVKPIFLKKAGLQCWQIKDPSEIQSEWCLFLERDEYLKDGAISELLGLLSGLDKTPHVLSVSRFLPAEEIGQFSWVTTREQFSAPTLGMMTYHVLELRLVPSDLVDKVVLQRMESEERPFGFNLILIQEEDCEIEKKYLPFSLLREEPDPPENPWRQPEDTEIFLKGHHEFFRDSEFVAEFQWPRTLYLVIRTDHVPAVIEGLKRGITSKAIVTYTLHYLLRLGKYELVAQFLPLIPQHFDFGDPSFTQMKALAHYFVGDVKGARQIFERCCAHHSGDSMVLENTGKFFLLLEEYEKAVECFQKSLAASDKPEKKAHVETFLRVLEENQDRWPTLTVCIICRDEESLLPRALKSVLGLAEEVVVVDTGSSDRSRDIAKEFGASVLDLPWEHDFSHVRNFALKQATSDYVLMLDADEHLFTENLVDFNVMKKLLPLKSPRAFALTVGHFKTETDWIHILTGGSNFTAECEAIRILPRMPGLEYVGRVEETVSDSLVQLDIPVSVFSPNQMRIHHDVLDRELRVRRKLGAYERETDPNLVQILAAVRDMSHLNDSEGTVRWLRRLISKDVQAAAPFVHRMGIQLARLLEGESPEESKRILESLGAVSSHDKELTLALSSHFIRNGLFPKLGTLDFGKIGLESDMLTPGENSEYWIHGGIAVLERGDVNMAAWLLDQVLSVKPDNLLGQTARFYLLCRIGDLDSANSALVDIQDMIAGSPGAAVMTPMGFFHTVENLSGTLGKWGHDVERALLLRGSLALGQQMEYRI